MEKGFFNVEFIIVLKFVIAITLYCAYFAHILAKSVYILCTCVNPILPEDKDHEDETR